MAIEAFLLKAAYSKPGLVDADRIRLEVFPDKPAVAKALQNLPAAAAGDAVVIAKLFAVVAIHNEGIIHADGQKGSELAHRTNGCISPQLTKIFPHPVLIH